MLSIQSVDPNKTSENAFVQAEKIRDEQAINPSVESVSEVTQSKTATEKQSPQSTPFEGNSSIIYTGSGKPAPIEPIIGSGIDRKA